MLSRLPVREGHRATPIRAAGAWLQAACRRPRMVVRVVVVRVVVGSLAMGRAIGERGVKVISQILESVLGIIYLTKHTLKLG